MGEYPENSLATVKQEPMDDWSHTCAPIDLSLKDPGYNKNRTEIPVNLSDRPLQAIVPSSVPSPVQNTHFSSVNNQITRLQNNERRAFASSLQNIGPSWSPIQSTHIGSMNSDRTVLQNIDSGDLFANSLINQMPSSELSPVSINSMSSPELPHESQTCSQYEGLASQLAPVVRRRTMRPFKAFPNNPIAVPIQTGLLDVTSSDKFSRFRSHMLEHLRNHNNSATNKNMRRNTNSSQNEHNSDPLYLEKRKKNNEAAKRSRDARRAKEDEIAIRCAFFEKEYIRLSEENYQTKRQNAELKLRLSTLEANLHPVQRNVYVT